MGKQEKPGCYESYPAWVVIVSNLVTFSVYGAGLYLLYLVWPWLGLLFLIYLLWLEDSVLREGCVCCWYYGKACASGRGKLAPLLHKKGESKKFSEKDMSMKDMIPHFLVSIIPAITGVYLLIQSFDLLVLGLAAWPLIVTFLGNPIIYGKMSCPYCRQRKMGCPACEFFMKKEKK